MAPIKIKHVVSFSSQDEKQPIENLLHGCGRWLCHKSERSGRMEAVLQLENPSQITRIDIGAYFCFTVELLVGCSTWPQSREFVPVVGPHNFLLPFACKVGNKKDVVEMFKQEKFNAEARGKEWDRIKIVCLQPFKRDTQFGISFIKLGNSYTAQPEKGVLSPKNGNRSVQSEPSPNRSISEIERHFFGNKNIGTPKTDSVKEKIVKLGTTTENTAANQIELGRATKLVVAACNKIPRYKDAVSNAPASRSYVDSSGNEKTRELKSTASKTPFDVEVKAFLHSLDFAALDLETLQISELRHRLERRKGRKLSKEEKKEFMDMAREFASSIITTDEENQPKANHNNQPKSNHNNSPTHLKNSPARVINHQRSTMSSTASGKSPSMDKSHMTGSKSGSAETPSRRFFQPTITSPAFRVKTPSRSNGRPDTSSPVTEVKMPKHSTCHRKLPISNSPSGLSTLNAGKQHKELAPKSFHATIPSQPSASISTSAQPSVSTLASRNIPATTSIPASRSVASTGKASTNSSQSLAGKWKDTQDLCLQLSPSQPTANRAQSQATRRLDTQDLRLQLSPSQPKSNHTHSQATRRQDTQDLHLQLSPSQTSTPVRKPKSAESDKGQSTLIMKRAAGSQSQSSLADTICVSPVVNRSSKTIIPKSSYVLNGTPKPSCVLNRTSKPSCVLNSTPKPSCVLNGTSKPSCVVNSSTQDLQLHLSESQSSQIYNSKAFNPGTRDACGDNSNPVKNSQSMNLELSLSSESEQMYDNSFVVNTGRSSTSSTQKQSRKKRNTKDNGTLDNTSSNSFRQHSFGKPEVTSADVELSQHVDELDSLLSRAKLRRKKKRKKTRPGEPDVDGTKDRGTEGSSIMVDRSGKSDIDDSMLSENLELPVKRKGKKRKKQNTSECSSTPVDKKSRTEEQSYIYVSATPEVMVSPQQSFSSPPNMSVELVTCPLCAVEMPGWEIEAHAATCDGPLSTQPRAGSHGRAPCPVCGDVFPVQVLPQHADCCLTALQAF